MTPTFATKGERTCISQPFTAPYDLLASRSASFTGRPSAGESATGGRFVLNGWGSSRFMGYDVTYVYDETEFTLGESWGWAPLVAGQTYRFQLETELGFASAEVLDYYECSYTVTFARP